MLQEYSVVSALKPIGVMIFYECWEEMEFIGGLSRCFFVKCKYRCCSRSDQG